MADAGLGNSADSWAAETKVLTPATSVRDRDAPKRDALYIGPTETTRYLCAATEIDESFCRRVLTEVVDQPYRAVGPSYGLDIAAIARQAIAAHRRKFTRDVLLLATLIGLVAIVAWRLGSDTGDELRQGVSFERVIATLWPAIFPFAIAWLVTASAAWVQQTRILPKLVAGRFDAGAAQPRTRRRTQQRLQALTDARTANVVVFSGFNPFVGSGSQIDSWSFAIDVTKTVRDPQTGAPIAPKPFTAEELHEHLMSSLQGLGLPSLLVNERLFVDGFDAAYSKALLPQRLAAPRTHVPTTEVRRALRNADGALRTYLCLEALGWHGQLVVTMFVRAVRLPGSLFVEASAFALLPLKDSYYRIDAWRPRSALESALTSFGRAAGDSLPLLFASPVRVAAAISRSRRTARDAKWQRSQIADGRLFDYGARTSIREEAMGVNPNRYFLQLDEEMYVKVAQERLLDSISEFLRAHDVDTGELRAQQTVINQNRTVNYDIRNVSGTNFAIGSKAIGKADVRGAQA